MSPAIYDHLQPTSEEYRDGIYRVVGTDEDTVTLLRVGDADGRRRNTGELVTVDRDAIDSFESAENPDGNQPVGAVLRSVGASTYWSVRTFAMNLVANPLPSLVALLVLLAGALGPDYLDMSGPVETGLIVVGALALTYIGSGRL